MLHFIIINYRIFLKIYIPNNCRLFKRIERIGLRIRLVSREELGFWPPRKNTIVYCRVRRISAFTTFTKFATDTTIRRTVASARNRFTSIRERIWNKYNRYAITRTILPLIAIISKDSKILMSLKIWENFLTLLSNV